MIGTRSSRRREQHVEVDFKVERGDGRFEVEVDIDDAKPGTRWRVVPQHLDALTRGA